MAQTRLLQGLSVWYCHNIMVWWDFNKLSKLPEFLWRRALYVYRLFVLLWTAIKTSHLEFIFTICEIEFSATATSKAYGKCYSSPKGCRTSHFHQLHIFTWQQNGPDLKQLTVVVVYMYLNRGVHTLASWIKMIVHKHPADTTKPDSADPQTMSGLTHRSSHIWGLPLIATLQQGDLHRENSSCGYIPVCIQSCGPLLPTVFSGFPGNQQCLGLHGVPRPSSAIHFTMSGRFMHFLQWFLEWGSHQIHQQFKCTFKALH